MTNLLRTRGLSSLLLVTVGALALATVAGLALTHGTMPGTGTWHAGSMWSDGHMSGWGPRSWWMLFVALVWTTALVAVPVYLSSRLTRSSPGNRSEDSALAVLREQYARGEIADEEFERRRSRLADDDGR